ncbi:MAG: radical SAM family heme chaperone HemW [Gammaproteobacteria bacterium]|nr:radical SAM family heme chaperone HemW [Gammaproteobacteria bacterium]
MTEAITSLYIHIPFCASKCFYCDFNSYVTPPAVRQAYVEQLNRELTLVRDEYFGTHSRPVLDTVFFGGGTPTMLSVDEWRLVARRIHELFTLSATAEWTVEANPGTVGSELLRELRLHGVNRISFGVQTLNDMLLQAIGRLHTAADALRSIELASAAGFARINIDLMLGLPDQTQDDVADALECAIGAGVRHISAYSLKIEEHTPFAQWDRRGWLRFPSEDAEADMYEMVRARLGEAGLLQYEISNFAARGDEARHNLAYWRNDFYLAAGAGAHGYVNGERYRNVRPLPAYANRLAEGVRPVEEVVAVPEAEAMEDTMMLGLRLAQGVTQTRFRVRHGTAMHTIFGAIIERLEERGLLMDDGRRVWIPPARYTVANEVFAEFVGALTAG